LRGNNYSRAVVARLEILDVEFTAERWTALSWVARTLDAFGNALGQGLVDQAQAQGVGPYSDVNYVNGMDLASDQAYEARRTQEWIAQSDRIQGKRLDENFARQQAELADAGGRIIAQQYPGGSYGEYVKAMSAAAPGVSVAREQQLERDRESTRFAELASVGRRPMAFLPDAPSQPLPASTYASSLPGSYIGPWDGKSVASVSQAQALRDDSFNFQAGRSLIDGTIVLAAPEIAVAKAAPLVGRLIAGGERFFGVSARSAETIGSASTDAAYTFNTFDNPGPLALLPNKPIANFFGGRYNAITLEDDLILYRAGEAGPGKELGQWFTREAPQSVAQTRIDSAVMPQWIDPRTGVLGGTSPVDTVYSISIPKGTTIFEGPVGTQGGVYLGGMNKSQIYINQPWNIPGVKMIGSTPLK